MDGLLDGVMGRRGKKSWGGESEWCAGLGGAFLLVTWQSGVPPHNSWGANRLVHPLAPTATEEPCPALLGVQLRMHLLARPSW